MRAVDIIESLAMLLIKMRSEDDANESVRC